MPLHPLAGIGGFRHRSLAGARIEARIAVAAKRQTRNPDRGIVALDFKVTDAAGTVVQAGVNQLMIYCEDAPLQTL